MIPRKLKPEEVTRIIDSHLSEMDLPIGKDLARLADHARAIQVELDQAQNRSRELLTVAIQEGLMNCPKCDRVEMRISWIPEESDYAEEFRCQSCHNYSTLSEWISATHG